MTKTYKELDELSAQFAKTMMRQLHEFSAPLPRDLDVEPAPSPFSEQRLEAFYRRNMLRSLLSLLPVAPPAE